MLSFIASASAAANAPAAPDGYRCLCSAGKKNQVNSATARLRRTAPGGYMAKRAGGRGAWWAGI